MYLPGGVLRPIISGSLKKKNIRRWWVTKFGTRWSRPISEVVVVWHRVAGCSPRRILCCSDCELRVLATSTSDGWTLHKYMPAWRLFPRFRRRTCMCMLKVLVGLFNNGRLRRYSLEKWVAGSPEGETTWKPENDILSLCLLLLDIQRGNKRKR